MLKYRRTGSRPLNSGRRKLPPWAEGRVNAGAESPTRSGWLPAELGAGRLLLVSSPFYDVLSLRIPLAARRRRESDDTNEHCNLGGLRDALLHGVVWQLS